jgi:CheY-like chemotaxis protein
MPELSKAYLDDELKPGDYVCAEVSDTGCGMTREALSRIFDPFFTTKAGGHGLGLAAVLGILRAHQAGIFIESEINRGTTFRIVFPEEPGATKKHEPEVVRTGSESLAAGRVLVADDEEAVRNVTCKTLERMGFECVSCANGVEALALIEEQAPALDLVLLDMTMPELGGDEVLAEMRRRGADMPVILMSGFSAIDTSPEVLAQGTTEFIEKPFGPRELAERVRRLLGAHKNR